MKFLNIECLGGGGGGGVSKFVFRKTILSFHLVFYAIFNIQNKN